MKHAHHARTSTIRRFTLAVNAAFALSACGSGAPATTDAPAPPADAAATPDAVTPDAMPDAMPAIDAGMAQLSCRESLQLPAGLSYHMAQGTCLGNVCSWDYDPPGAEITRIHGEYDQGIGTFWWQVSHDPSHWRVSTAVSGTGAITPEGDEDSSFTATTTDILGAVTIDAVVQERVGCDITRTTTDAAGRAFVLQGTFGNAFTYTEGQIPELWSGDFPVDASGERTPGGAVTETIMVPPSTDDEMFWWGYAHTLTADADGNSSVSFNQWNVFSSWARTGMCSWNIAHEQSCSVRFTTEDWGGDVYWTVNHAGDGSGVFSAEFYGPGGSYDQNCPVTFASGTCTVECPAGQRPNCFLFLMP